MRGKHRYYSAVGESPEQLADKVNELIKDNYSVLHIGGPVYCPHNGEWCQALWVWVPPEEPMDDLGVFRVKLEEPDEWELAGMMHR